jgi:exopolyphosphatase/guanosine-5'-triphosphate,3'-diphosphate pyrophosphatase
LILAAIDIGSNAARLLVAEAKQYKTEVIDFTKLNLIRIPLQLGIDVFGSGFIGAKRRMMLMQTMKAFQSIMDLYGVEHYRACATSAMRDASNAVDITDEILRETGIRIEIISGTEEASIVYETHIAETINQNDGTFLYVDVGGGSTEVSLFSERKSLFQESFNIGTIRLMQHKVLERDWDALKRFLKNRLKGYENIRLIGSGGNINKVSSISKNKEDKPLKYNTLKGMLDELSACTVEERMHRYHLREDRAQVIVPALTIYTQIMRWSDAKEVFVPRIGLVDGIVRMLYKVKSK